MEKIKAASTFFKAPSYFAFTSLCEDPWASSYSSLKPKCSDSDHQRTKIKTPTHWRSSRSTNASSRALCRCPAHGNHYICLAADKKLIQGTSLPLTPWSSWLVAQAFPAKLRGLAMENGRGLLSHELSWGCHPLMSFFTALLIFSSWHLARHCSYTHIPKNIYIHIYIYIKRRLRQSPPLSRAFPLWSAWVSDFWVLLC